MPAGTPRRPGRGSDAGDGYSDRAGDFDSRSFGVGGEPSRGPASPVAWCSSPISALRSSGSSGGCDIYGAVGGGQFAVELADAAAVGVPCRRVQKRLGG